MTFASGRTDKYVHAFNQVISFKNKKILEAESIQKFLNNNLSHIYVKNVEYMDDSFNARFSAKSKSYLYIINNPHGTILPNVDNTLIKILPCILHMI